MEALRKRRHDLVTATMLVAVPELQHKSICFAFTRFRISRQANSIILHAQYTNSKYRYDTEEVIKKSIRNEASIEVGSTWWYSERRGEEKSSKQWREDGGIGRRR